MAKKTTTKKVVAKKVTSAKKTAVKKTVKKKAAVKKTAVKKTAIKKSVAKKAVAKKSAAKKRAPKKKAAASAAKGSEKFHSTVLANVDVGFGNQLYVRGSAGGLSWEKGVLMENTSADEWGIELSGYSDDIELKFLLNDETWSLGENYIVPAGSKTRLEPEFE